MAENATVGAYDLSARKQACLVNDQAKAYKTASLGQRPDTCSF